MILQSRNNFLELKKEQQDLIILGKIEAGKATNALGEAYENSLEQRKYEKRKDTEGTKGNIAYIYYKLPI